MKAVRAIVRGRVQGVGFRAATAARGTELGLDGWVRNLLDGRVETEARGDDAAVDRFVAWLQHGDPPARVMGVEIEELPAGSGGSLQGFRIR